MHRRAFLAAPCLLACGCAVFRPTATPAPVVRGPLPVITNGPIVANLLPFRPRGAETTPPRRLLFEFDGEYSSMFEDGTDGQSTVLFDGEILRTTFRFRTGLTSSADIETGIPIAYASAGFLDAFITGWHAFFNLPNGGRGKRGRDEFAMRADVGSVRAYEMDDERPALGDVPVIVTQRLLREDRAGVSLDARAGVEIPTGAERRGFGNGGIDWGGGLLAEKSVGRFTFSAGAYLVDAATPESFERAGIETAEQRQLHAGAECRWNEWVSIVAGLRSGTPATRGIGIEEVDGDVLDLDVGFVFDDPQTDRRIQFGLSEDLIAESGPDFTVFFAWSFLF